MNVNERIADLVRAYGDGSDGASPDAGQWRAVLDGPQDRPVVLVNFFKFRERAVYPDGEVVSGQDAFARYASVSMPALERAGGHFLHVGGYGGSFIGDDAGWDMVAIGQYPDTAALLALFDDPEYRKAFPHRHAACERQRVIFSRG